MVFFCPACWREIKAGDKKCPHCGADITEHEKKGFEEKLHTISKLLGHKDLRMTTRYSHLSLDTLRGAVSALNLQTVTFPLRSEDVEGFSAAVTS